MAKKRIITNPKFIVEREGNNWVLKFKDGKIYKTVEFLNAQNSGNKNGVVTNPNFSIIGINVYVNINDRNVKVGEVGDNYILESKIGNVIDEPNLDAVITSSGNIIIGVYINGKHVALNDDFSKTRIQYKATTKPTSTWISTNCIRNKFANGRGELVLKNGVTTLEGDFDIPTQTGRSIFNDSITITNLDTNILEVVIPDGIEVIGSASLACCSALNKITLPSSLLEIGDWAFVLCTTLKSITFSNIIVSIGDGAFFGCTSLTSATIADSVISIGREVYNGCISLNSVTLSNNLTEISENAFENCTSLTSITIPELIETIKEKAFNNCSSLVSVTCEATNPPTLGKYNFTAKSNDTLYVPSESLQAYLDDTAWNNAFDGNIQAIS